MSEVKLVIFLYIFLMHFHLWVGQLLVLSIARPSSLKLLLIAAVMHARHSVHRSSHLYNDKATTNSQTHFLIKKSFFFLFL